MTHHGNLAGKPPLGLKTAKAAKPAGKPGVSKSVRDFARGQTCTLRLGCCNGDPATTVHAHLRLFNWAGVGQKPPDFLGVHACRACHDALDGRSSVAVDLGDVLRALGETQIRLHRAGLLTI